ncbi:NAD-dependent epimerase/dehydratase family protein [Jeotgalibacillus sp. R-1-5s-1]|uniref:NAD-dependent epimerase/dehydratase family protein n=1 Tax=Jeotgalibacillus sp. R-1-5s-1 TaxID=2555897 RepID=UPI001069F509|nr:NAD-dependent epimerase/dehydratase family protein [Jeotgalibacillus sp. R-1-5s-1]TFD98311.1 NAD-dependent epimerase/dehydratase family protein [Jeotgalibacillus sp. R-1-5s-1]
MRLLILGGTQFLGKHITESALKAGHEVTLFNRGKTNTALFPAVKKLTGDRNDDLSALEEGSWDAVIDVSGYVPSQVRKTAELLKDRVRHYTFVSTISVYSDFSKGPAIEEYTPLGELEEETEEVNGATYGPLKQKSEEVVKSVYGKESLIIRPGLIVGPDDPTDRFTYWVWRASKGGTAVAPGKPSRQVQWIDVRDLSEWMIRMVEKQENGTYNAAGAKPFPTMEEYLTTAKRVTNSDVDFIWVEDETLKNHEVSPFVEVPFWIPVSAEIPDGFILADTTRATQKGLTFRPLEETISDTYLWLSSRENHEWKAGMTEEKEKNILSDVQS